MNIGDILGMGSSALGGGLFGFLGPIVQRGIGIWEAKEKRKDQALANAQEEKRWAAERELIVLQQKGAEEGHEQELELADSRGGWEALNASINADASVRPSYRWVDAVRALTRPVLTLLCQVLVAVVFLLVRVRRPDLEGQMVDAVLFAGMASLLWWFGERASRPAVRK